MRNKFLLILLLIIIAFGSTAQAQQEKFCIYNGKAYPPGTRLGPYVCKDGKWK